MNSIFIPVRSFKSQTSPSGKYLTIPSIFNWRTAFLNLIDVKIIPLFGKETCENTKKKSVCLIWNKSEKTDKNTILIKLLPKKS